MKISLLLPSLQGGGAERVSLDLANTFRDLGHHVEFVLMRAEGEFLTTAKCRHSVINLDAKRVRNVARPLATYLHSNRPDALIAAMWPLTFFAPLAVRLSGHRCPVLAVEHGTLSRQYAGWGYLTYIALRISLALAFRLVDARAGVSSGVAEDAAKLAFYPSSRVSTLYNPIPPRSAASDHAIRAASETWKGPPGRRIIAVGNLKEVKNHNLLLTAFAKLSDPAASLMILGQGELGPQLQQVAGELGVSDRVVFAGFHPDPTPFYETADLFVLSSNHEGLPTVLIEALSCGLPVVSTDCPSGPAEILENGRYGRLTPVGDAEALAAAMREALAAAHDREALKRRAADFSPEHAARAYLSALGLE